MSDMPPRDPMSAAAHAEHDTLLVAQLAAGDPLDERRQAEASALVARCSECASLAADLRAVSGAVAWEPVPPRRRDFRITAAQAEAARGSRLQRFLARLTPPDTRRLQPVAAGVLSLGLLLMVAGTAWPEDTVPVSEAEPVVAVPELATQPSPEGPAEAGAGREDVRDEILEGFDQPRVAATAPPPAQAEPPDARFRADGQSGAAPAAGAAVEEEELDAPADVAQKAAEAADLFEAAEAADGAGLEVEAEVESNAFFGDTDAATPVDEVGDDAVDSAAESLQQRAAKATRPGLAAEPATTESDASDLRVAGATQAVPAQDPAAPVIERAEVGSTTTDTEPVGAREDALERPASSTLEPRLAAAAGEASATGEPRPEPARLTSNTPVDEGIGIETWLLVVGLALAVLGLALLVLSWLGRQSRRDPYRP